MKRTVLILSLIAPVLLYVVGNFFFFASGFGIDYMAPPTSPRRIIGTLIGCLPGLIVAIIALWLSLAATARSRQIGWFAGLLVWPVVPIAAGMLMVTSAVGLSESWWLAVLFVPLGTLIYGLIGPEPVAAARPQDAPGAIQPPPNVVHPPSPRAPFLVFVGVLALVAVLGAATLMRGAPPFFPLPGPTPTIGPPVLSVHVEEGAANCATGSYPTVTITNTVQQTVLWSARVNDSGISVTPASGSLDTGASTTVTISGKATTQTFFTITFTAQGSQNLAKIACISG